MITLEIQRVTGNEERFVDSGGTVTGACPGCNATPFRIKAVRLRETAEATIAGGYCVDCADPVGFITVPKKSGDTIFGAEEDRAVLEFGRARVY